jgi:hypothetical protein
MAKKQRTSILEKTAAFEPTAEAKAEFDKFHNALIEIRTKNQELYDQNLLTLSSAALGLSVAFIIKQAAKNTVFHIPDPSRL